MRAFPTPGVSLSRLMPQPGHVPRGHGEAYYAGDDVFQSSERSRVWRTSAGFVPIAISPKGPTSTSAGRLRTVPDGTSTLALIGADLRKRLFGFDATLRYRPLRRAIYRRFQARTEFVWSQSRGTGQPGGDGDGFLRQRRVSVRAALVCGRALRSLRPSRSTPSIVDTGGSVFLTYWPSEFNQVRGQYRRTNYGDGVRGNEFLFQFLFSIGAHGAHVF